MLPPVNDYATHEWWAPNGKSVYYCNNQMIARNSLDGSEGEVVCNAPIEGGAGVWHVFCTQDEKYFIFDGSWPYGERSWWRRCESMVRFYNTETQRIVPLITRNPLINGWTPENPSIYHIDAHPRFVLHDSLVTLNTTTQGHVDLAVAEAAQLIEMTR